MRPVATPARPPLVLPSAPHRPARTLAARLGLALALITFVALVCFLGGDGYRDGDEVPADLSLLDAF